MRTKNYATQVALKMQKQLTATASDLYGGANDVTPGTGNLKLFDLDGTSITDASEKVVDTSVNGTQADNYQETVAVLPTVEVSTSVHTVGDADLLVSALGWENLDGPKNPSTGVYVHMIPLQEQGKEQREYTSAEQALVPSGFDVDDKINTYCHIAIDKGPSTEHAKNVVLKGFEFSSQQKQELKAKFTGTAESVTRDETHSGVSSWSKAVGGYSKTYKHYQGKLSVGAVGEALAEIQCLEFAVKGSFGLAEGLVPTGTSNGGKSQAEPLSDGKTELTVDFRVYKHDTDLFKGWELGDTFISLKMEYTSAPSFLGFYLPNLQVVSAQDESGDGGSIMVSCRAMLPTEEDPFETERTVDAEVWDVPFATRLYLIAKDSIGQNWLRVS